MQSHVWEAWNGKCEWAKGLGYVFFSLQSILQHFYLLDPWPFTENLFKQAHNSFLGEAGKEDALGWVGNSIPGAHWTVWGAAASTPLRPLQLPTTSGIAFVGGNSRGIWVSGLQMSWCKLRISGMLLKCLSRWNWCFYNLIFVLNKWFASHINTFCTNLISVTWVLQIRHIYQRMLSLIVSDNNALIVF